MPEDETSVLAAFVAARRWRPPAEPWTRGLPAEVVTTSDCLADFEPRDAEPVTAPWLRTLAEAVSAAEGAPGGSAPVHVLSASVPESAAADLVATLDPYPYPIQDNLARRLASPAGEVLGFEVLGFDCGRFHSWLCYDLLGPARDELGVHPGRLGLLTTLADARGVADRANRDRGASTGTPLEVTWFPVRITEHPRG